MTRTLLRGLLVLVPMVTAGSAEASPAIGVMADVGVPDGANGSIVFNPISRVRLAAGGGYNGISRGVRGGVTLVPFKTWVTPTLSLEYGNYVEGDANPLAQMISGDKTFHNDSLERIGYSYQNAHVGFEFGRRVVFYLHGGMSRITGSFVAGSMTSGDGKTTVTFTKDPSLEIFSVSARIGLMVYISK
jgi:hypothetical protein